MVKYTTMPVTVLNSEFSECNGKGRREAIKYTLYMAKPKLIVQYEYWIIGCLWESVNLCIEMELYCLCACSLNQFPSKYQDDTQCIVARLFECHH